jgi:Domain of unknown function (DUF4388)
MALTGELSDLSLAELIEFFCNQRKTGRLKVIYTVAPGYFYLQSGSVVHARIGVLRGIEAVYYALTLPNASFTFSPAFEAPEQTINQPWTSVVLEGLRQMDERIKPGEPFPDGHQVQVEEPKLEVDAPVEVAQATTDVVPAAMIEIKVVEPAPQEVVPSVEDEIRPKALPEVAPKVERAAFKAPERELPAAGMFLSEIDNTPRFGSWKLGAVIASVALIVAVIAVPWGWYARSKAARIALESQPAAAQTSQPVTSPAITTENSASPELNQTAASSSSAETADLAAKRLRETRLKEKAVRIQETTTTVAPSQPTPVVSSPNVARTQSSPAISTGSKKATVQVTYDENGRVTQASGGDATALRIARQKRFPPGKAGTATVTIPIN